MSFHVAGIWRCGTYMLDPELMVELIRDMSNNNGRTTVTLDGFDQSRLNHLNLLVDAGQAEWIRKDRII